MVGSPFFWLLFFGDAKKSHSARTNENNRKRTKPSKGRKRHQHIYQGGTETATNQAEK
jgi:hypothetical protein